MKKIFKLPGIIVILFTLSVVISCTNNEVEPLFDKTIKERTDEFKKKYIDILTSPENGWIGHYSPNNNSGGFTMLMDFNEDSSVNIKSDYRAGSQDNIITYRLDKTLKIELVLESHAVFSDIFEVNNNNNGGEFVFNILEATQDKVVLESKLDSGDDVTIFTLKRALTSDIDLTLIYTSTTNVSGDETQSVFRNILLNDKAIAVFNFDPELRKATVKYIKDGNVITVNEPIIINATGFSFKNPLELGGATLSIFTFDETTKEYINEEGNIKIKYDNAPVPGIIKPYDFKESRYNRAGFNYLDAGTSSTAFYNFWSDFTTNLPSNLTITWFAFFELSSKDVPYLQIYTPRGQINFWYDVSYEVRDDEKIYFTLTGVTNASAEITEALEPLIDLLIGDENGYYIPETGTLNDYNNTTFSLINASNPQYEINYYGY